MEKTKYILDRLDDGLYIFLEKGNEENQLLIPQNEVTVKIAEGDIVLIGNQEAEYTFEVLKKETADRKTQVSDLIEKLKNK